MKKESNPRPPMAENAKDPIKKHLNWLGVEVKCVVTDWKGIVTSVSFDLYGCVQVLVTKKTRKINADEPSKSWWMDVGRVVPVDGFKRVMPIPNYAGTKVGEEIGPAEKPIP